MQLNGKNIKLQIWDTAGQERFKNITASYYRGGNGILVVYDITDPNSATNMDEWINCLVEESPDVQVIVVGNKTDSSNRRVNSENILQYAAANQYEAVECSAKSGENVSEVFCKAAVMAYKMKNSYHGSVKVIHIL